MAATKSSQRRESEVLELKTEMEKVKADREEWKEKAQRRKWEIQSGSSGTKVEIHAVEDETEVLRHRMEQLEAQVPSCCPFRCLRHSVSPSTSETTSDTPGMLWQRLHHDRS